MSYILDALRRAEAERNRGIVPTLHSAPLVIAPVSMPQARLRWRLVALLCAALVLAAAAAWWFAMERPQTSVAPVATVTSPALPPAPAVRELASAGAVAPQPSRQPQADPVPAAPAQAAPTVPVRPPAARATGAAPATPPAAPRPPAAAAPPKTAPVFEPADLPASVRADLPSLRLAGITWSADPRMRMAIVNGQVLREGDAAAPGLVLRRIEAERTVWTFRGYQIAFGSQQ